MQFLNAKINQIIIHQIFKKNKELQIQQAPSKSTAYTEFDDSAMSNFRSRVSDALGENTKAVEMIIERQDATSLSRLVDRAINEDNEAFINSSFEIAKLLDKAQKKASYPGGIVVVFTGTCNFPDTPFLGIIKAETHNAYQKLVDPDTNKISLNYIEDVLLTPSARLYKTAAFLQKRNFQPDNEDLNRSWEVWVSDYQISQAEGKAAAYYFYNGFLGFTYPDTSARRTKLFFELTKKFISELEIDEEEKNDYINALISYIKVNTSPIISPVDFSNDYLNEDIREDLIESLEDNGLPRENFTKDVEHIKKSLKLRKLSFNSNIKLTASPEVFKEKISFESIKGTPDERGNIPEWTQIIVKEKITNQE
ncbi:nucleoid associated protein NdpA [Marinomonas alcarazii]|uniref:Nucleoid associated protein NdpA n=1 Tax=Marinomonas alcarazii TaxID=491949 RepID=A0A318V7E9_9GAMM|nr:nucleoid-associated protein [Marinomonas alcarazii]PYF84616.1 nucleoid associated protein NdpA [Marinomonas alcarazii]